MPDLQESLQTQTPSHRALAAALWREAVPVRQVREALLALRFLLAAHEPPLLLLQAGGRGAGGGRAGGPREGPPGAHRAAHEQGVLAGYDPSGLPGGASRARGHPEARRRERGDQGRGTEGGGRNVHKDRKEGRVRGGGGGEQEHGHGPRHVEGRGRERGALHGRQLAGR